MSLLRIWRVLRKDLALGPRSPFFLYTLLLPVVLTVVLQSAFGMLFAPRPRLALYDEGSSTITASLRRLEGLEIDMLDDVETLQQQVEANAFDAGLVLPEGFDELLRSGERPTLLLYFGGESYASNRFVIRTTIIDAVRELVGDRPPVEVEISSLGEEGLPLSLRAVPVIVFYALAMAGIFIPGASLVGEKERGTLMAMVVTPVSLREIYVAKWALGFLFASLMSALTLLLNQALGSRPLQALLVIAVAAALTAVLGLLVGVVSKDSAMLFGLIKGVGLLLFAPALFYLFPDWPQWIARIFPLYWIIEPIWRVAVMGEPIGVVWLEVCVALAITAVMLPLVIGFSGRRRCGTTADR